MEARQTCVTAGSIGLVVAAWVTACLIAPRGVPAPSAPASTFDPDRALDRGRVFGAEYPKRRLGDPIARQSSLFLKQQLEVAGCAIAYTHFPARVDGRSRVGRNVLGTKAGGSPETIALVAPYDSLDG